MTVSRAGWHPTSQLPKIGADTQLQLSFSHYATGVEYQRFERNLWTARTGSGTRSLSTHTVERWRTKVCVLRRVACGTPAQTGAFRNLFGGMDITWASSSSRHTQSKCLLQSPWQEILLPLLSGSLPNYPEETILFPLGAHQHDHLKPRVRKGILR